jgi:hypothetical protein
VAVPHRRTIKNGSFGARLDQLVEHFRHGPGGDEPPEIVKDPKPNDRNVHDRLFESAWRRRRDAEGQPPA